MNDPILEPSAQRRRPWSSCPSPLDPLLRHFAAADAAHSHEFQSPPVAVSW